MQGMKANGMKICSMVKVLRLGIMEQQDTQANSTKGRSMVKVDLIGKMVAIMRDNLCKGNLKASESTTLLILIRFIKANLGTATWKGEALRSGAMAEDMKVNSRTAKKTVKATFNGPMAICILALGDRVNSMESEYGLIKMEKDRENGIRVRD